MPAFADSPTPRPDRVFTIALGVLIVFGVVELLLTATHFLAKVRRTAPAKTVAATTAPATSVPSAAPAPSAPSVVAPPANEPPLSTADRLLKEAQALNERGDTANALARLQEAAQRDPKNAAVLAQMGSIYESIQLVDRANETWRKIEEIGPSAGNLYQLAEIKLKKSAAMPSEAATPPLDREGLPEGSTFGISDIAIENVPDPDAATNLRLKISVKKRDGVPIEISKLRIIVRFYDLVDDERVADTDADVSFEWFNPKHDWSESNPEQLIVTYLRGKNHSISSEAALSAAAAAVTPGKPPRTKKRTENNDAATAAASGGQRRYLGYVVRIFYDDKLQTVRADPARLLNEAPNSSTP